MKEEKVFFKNSKGQKLVGMLARPTKKTTTVILNCHGFTSGKEMQFIPALSKAIAESGFAAFRFDFTGNGESQGEFSEGTTTQETKDISSAIDFLEKKGYKKFGVVGHSMGGGVVIGAAASDKRIKAVCALAPSVRYHRNIKKYGLHNLLRLQFKGHFIYRKHDGREFKITKDYVKDKKRSKFFKKAKDVTQPLLVIHGTKDTSVGFAEGVELFHRAVNQKEFLAIGGADHNFTGYHHRQLLIDSAVLFFKRHLK